MFLASNLEKPKENQCFCFPRASGDPGGTIGPTTPKKIYHKLPIHRPSGIYVKKSSLLWQACSYPYNDFRIMSGSPATPVGSLRHVGGFVCMEHTLAGRPDGLQITLGLSKNDPKSMRNPPGPPRCLRATRNAYLCISKYMG
mgnify:CR=1 FL=1